MNQYTNIINHLVEVRNKLESEWENAHWAQNNSTIQSDINHYEDIKNKVNELQEIINQQIKEME